MLSAKYIIDTFLEKSTPFGKIHNLITFYFTCREKNANIYVYAEGSDKMETGISSSCFYPVSVEDSLKQVGELGAKTAEIFFNSYCELSGNILDELRRIKDYYGMNIRSIHPFSCSFETVLLFSNYDRRTNDGVEFYKNYFEAANIIGAEAVVLHGCKDFFLLSPEEYAEHYVKLHNAAKEHGVFIAQENVNAFLCANPEYMKSVADFIGDDFKMVLDIKQCRRSGQSEFEFIRLLGRNIVQVHISDFNEKYDCMVPGKGKYDFEKLFRELKKAGYNKTALIELYRKGFNEAFELAEAMNNLNFTARGVYDE